MSNSNKISNGRLGGLIEFLDNYAEKGRAPKKTCAALKVSVKKIFQTVEPDSWQEIEVRSLNLDEYTARFKNITAGKYTDVSLKTYNARTSRAIRWYLNFLKNPGWTPEENDSRKKLPKEKNNPKLIPKQPKVKIINEPISKEVVDTSLMDFQLPLSTGEIISLSLPKKISKNDSERIKQFISILTMEEE